jgi:hypothetical protein
LPDLILIGGAEFLLLSQVVEDSGNRCGLKVIDGEIGDKFLVGNVDPFLMFNDELNNLQPPTDHFHLLLRKVEAAVVIYELGLVVELGEGLFERVLNLGLF